MVYEMIQNQTSSTQEIHNVALATSYPRVDIAEAIVAGGHRLCRVITVPDEKYLSGMHAMAEWCAAHRVPMEAKPTDEIVPDPSQILISVGYTRILPRAVFGGFKYAVNLHPSLLPEHRGRYPHQEVLIDGDERTGATLHLIDDGVDTGTCIAWQKIPVSITDTVETLTARTREIEPSMVRYFLRDPGAVWVYACPQSEPRGPKHPAKRTPAHSELRPDMTLEAAVKAMRAFKPEYPGFVVIDGVRFNLSAVRA